MSRAAGPFKILAKINDNAYKLELPPEFRVSPSFNISDLRPYFGEEEEMPSSSGLVPSIFLDLLSFAGLLGNNLQLHRPPPRPSM
jgi:hypothetical protein